MKATLISRAGTWRDVADAARVTVGMGDGAGEPPRRWKAQMLLAEHSPIRLLQFTIQLDGLKSWISVHLVRHKIGVEHFVRTQRDDRQKPKRRTFWQRLFGIFPRLDRDTAPQGALVAHRIVANPQAAINISRKRLCFNNPHKETRQTWLEALETLRDTEPELVAVCVPECIYRGFCPEIKKCGYSRTIAYRDALMAYRQPAEENLS